MTLTHAASTFAECYFKVRRTSNCPSRFGKATGPQRLRSDERLGHRLARGGLGMLRPLELDCIVPIGTEAIQGRHAKAHSGATYDAI